MTILLALFIVLMVVLDQLIKTFVLQAAAQHLLPVTIIPGAFDITYTQNPGAAFGILQESRWVFISASILIVCVGLFLLFTHRTKHSLIRSAVALVVAGGIGNLIDRILVGSVVDMFQFTFVDFPVFNFADTCVLVGAALLMIGILISPDGLDLKFGRRKKDSPLQAEGGDSPGDSPLYSG